MIEGYIMGALIGLNIIIGRIYNWNKHASLSNNIAVASMRAFFLGFTVIVCKYLTEGTQELVTSLLIATAVCVFTLMIYALCAINKESD